MGNLGRGGLGEALELRALAFEAGALELARLEFGSFAEAGGTVSSIGMRDCASGSTPVLNFFLVPELVPVLRDFPRGNGR